MTPLVEAHDGPEVSRAVAAGATVIGVNNRDLTTFTVDLAVPADAPVGTFVNTSGPLTATIGGEAVEGNSAVDELIIMESPILTKEFIDDPAGAGGQATMQFTITNTSATAAATMIEFTDDLAAALPGLAATGLPLVDICGTGSSVTGLAGDSWLTFSGGTLEPAGQPGESCTFDVVVDVPEGAPAGIYTNTQPN